MIKEYIAKQRTLFTASFYLLSFLLLTLVIVKLSFFKAIDETLAVRDRPFYSTERYFSLMIFDNYGLRWVSFIVLASFSLLAYKRVRKSFLLFTPLIALLVVNLSVAGVKFFVDRSKPTSGRSTFFTENYHSYPSGHMVNIIVMYLLSFYIIKKFTLFKAKRVLPYRYLNVAMTIGFIATSVERNTHWLSDLLAGVLLGLAIYYFVKAWLENLTK